VPPSKYFKKNMFNSYVCLPVSGGHSIAAAADPRLPEELHAESHADQQHPIALFRLNRID